MSKNIFLFPICIIALLGFCLGVFNFYQLPKIGYIRSQDLVSKYNGTKDALKKLEQKKEKWQSNIDTLSFDLRRGINKYNAESKNMSSAKKKELEDFFLVKREELEKYSEAINQKVSEEDRDLMQGVLNQVNSYVEEYAKKNKYQMIFGTTVSGSVMYGDKNLDITDEILKGLNEKYKGKE